MDWIPSIGNIFKNLTSASKVEFDIIQLMYESSRISFPKEATNISQLINNCGKIMPQQRVGVSMQMYDHCRINFVMTPYISIKSDVLARMYKQAVQEWQQSVGKYQSFDKK